MLFFSFKGTSLTSVHGVFQSRILEWVAISFLIPGLFPTQGLKPDFLHWRQILYRWSYRGSPLCCGEGHKTRTWERFLGTESGFWPPVGKKKKKKKKKKIGLCHTTARKWILPSNLARDLSLVKPPNEDACMHAKSLQLCPSLQSCGP